MAVYHGGKVGKAAKTLAAKEYIQGRCCNQ